MVGSANLTTPPELEGVPLQTWVLLVRYSSFSDIASHANRLDCSSICTRTQDYFHACSAPIASLPAEIVRQPLRIERMWCQKPTCRYPLAILQEMSLVFRQDRPCERRALHSKFNDVSSYAIDTQPDIIAAVRPLQRYRRAAWLTSQKIASVASLAAAWTTGLEARLLKTPTRSWACTLGCAGSLPAPSKPYLQPTMFSFSK